MPSDHFTEIYAGNLPYDAQKEDLEDVFKTFGRILDARIVTEKGSRKSKGFGFVRFDSVDDAEAAIKDGAQFRGRKLILKWAREKPQKDGNEGKAHLSPRRSRSRRRSRSPRRSRERRSSGSDRSLERPRRGPDGQSGKAQLSARKSRSPSIPRQGSRHQRQVSQDQNRTQQRRSPSSGRSPSPPMPPKSPSIQRPKDGNAREHRRHSSPEPADRRREKEKVKKGRSCSREDKERSIELQKQLSDKKKEKGDLQEEVADLTKATRLFLESRATSAAALEDLRAVMDRLS